MSGRSTRMPEVPRKSDRELELMREAGRIVANVLASMEEAAAPGVSTAQLDELAEQMIVSSGARPSSKGYRGYPATICADLEDVVVHGIPSEAVILEDGQLFGVDLAAEYHGYHADAAISIGVGDISSEKRSLLEETREALRLGIAAALAGNRLVDISRTVQQHVESRGFSVVRDLVGHGIGRQYHEPPQVPNFVTEGEFPDYGLTLRPGMTLAIEPMVNMGTHRVTQDPDKWTIRTADGLPSAHFEHTVAVTKDGPAILTLP